MSIGISQNDWQTMQQKHYYASTKASQRRYVSNSTKVDNNANTQASESGNTCTDGKDDGKVGFFSAIGHAVKGAVKGVVNGIKGCFTDKDGKFSIGKTLLTVAAGAACIAFPAVGLVACGVGAAVGTANFAKGVYNAATAETDAQAKDAWEQVGDGAFTAVTSAVGVKSSLSAVKATSTAGLSSVDDVAYTAKNLGASDDALKAIREADDVAGALKAAKSEGLAIDGSKLGNLAQDASKLDKAKALASDMGSSTKNQSVIVKAKFGELKNSAKTAKDAKTYNKNSEQIRQYKEKIDNGTITQEEYTSYKELCKEQGKYDQAVRDKANDLMLDEAYKENLSYDKKAAKDALKEAKKSKDKSAIETAQQNYDAAKQAQKESTTFGKYTSKTKDTLAEKSQTYKNLTEQKTTFKEAVKNAEGIKGKLNAIKENAGSTTFNAIKNGLTEDGKTIYKLLTSTNNGYAQAVKQYGYDNVLQVVETFAGYRVTDEAV